MARIRTVFNEMVLCQTLKTGRVGETLRKDHANSDSKFLNLGIWPAIDVLQETKEGDFLQRLLEILVSA